MLYHKKDLDEEHNLILNPAPDGMVDKGKGESTLKIGEEGQYNNILIGMILLHVH